MDGWMMDGQTEDTETCLAFHHLYSLPLPLHLYSL